MSLRWRVILIALLMWSAGVRDDYLALANFTLGWLLIWGIWRDDVRAEERKERKH